MTELAFCKYSSEDAGGLYAIDLTSGASEKLVEPFPPIAAYSASIATAPDGYIYYVLHRAGMILQASGTYIARMRANQMKSNTWDSEVIYEYSAPDAVNYVAVRPSPDPIGYRVYFSAIVDPTSQQCTIYYLDESKQAVPYVTLSGADLPAGPCGQQWAGLFAFSDDSLYIASNTSPTAIFRLTGAGLTHVSGTPELVYPSCDVIAPATVNDALVCDGAAVLYFLGGFSDNTISRLDVSTGELSIAHTSTARLQALCPMLLPKAKSYAPSLEDQLHNLREDSETLWADTRQLVATLIKNHGWWPTPLSTRTVPPAGRSRETESSARG